MPPTLSRIARSTAANTRGSLDCATLNRKNRVADCETLKTLPGASTMPSSTGPAGRR